MKRFLAFVCIMLFMCGCNGTSDATAQGEEIRQKLLKGNGCKFISNITADFGQLQYSFKLACSVDKKGVLYFTVLEPESIADITGHIDEQSGNLTFDETVLAFPHLAEGEIPPVCAPWLFYKALYGGYIRAGGADAGTYHLTIDDSFRGEDFVLELWLRDELYPMRAEIVWEGSAILMLEIQQFEYL